MTEITTLLEEKVDQLTDRVAGLEEEIEALRERIRYLELDQSDGYEIDYP